MGHFLAIALTLAAELSRAAPAAQGRGAYPALGAGVQGALRGPMRARADEKGRIEILPEGKPIEAVLLALARAAARLAAEDRGIDWGDVPHEDADLGRYILREGDRVAGLSVAEVPSQSAGLLPVGMRVSAERGRYFLDAGAFLKANGGEAPGMGRSLAWEALREVLQAAFRDLGGRGTFALERT